MGAILKNNSYEEGLCWLTHVLTISPNRLINLTVANIQTFVLRGVDCIRKRELVEWERLFPVMRKLSI
jgi:hypothetical protein